MRKYPSTRYKIQKKEHGFTVAKREVGTQKEIKTGATPEGHSSPSIQNGVDIPLQIVYDARVVRRSNIPSSVLFNKSIMGNSLRILISTNSMHALAEMIFVSRSRSYVIFDPMCYTNYKL